MWAVVGPQEGRQSSETSRLQLELQLQPAALRLRLYELRVGVDW